MNLWLYLHKRNSGKLARNRLKLLLIADQLNCSPELLEQMRDDMVYVVSKYMEIDGDRVKLGITRDSGTCLYANIPICRIPDKRTK